MSSIATWTPKIWICCQHGLVAPWSSKIFATEYMEVKDQKVTNRPAADLFALKNRSRNAPCVFDYRLSIRIQIEHSKSIYFGNFSPSENSSASCHISLITYLCR
jgi:hypothetical protein